MTQDPITTVPTRTRTLPLAPACGLFGGPARCQPAAQPRKDAGDRYYANILTKTLEKSGV